MIKYSKIAAYLLTFFIFITLFVNIVGILNSNLRVHEKIIELLLNGLFVGIILSIISSFIKIRNNIYEFNCLFITNKGRSYFYFFYILSMFLVLLYSFLGIFTILLGLAYPVDYAFFYMMMIISCSLIPKESIRGFIYLDNSNVFLGINKILKSDIKNVDITKRKFGLGYDIFFILERNEMRFNVFANFKTKENLIKSLKEQGIPLA